MQEAGFISAGEFKQASVAPLGLTEQPTEARQQAYFVDMVKAQLLAQFSEADLLSKGYRVYTTLDLDLQQAASEGARAGLIELDRQVKKAAGSQEEVSAGHGPAASRHGGSGPRPPATSRPWWAVAPTMGAS